MSLRPFFKSLLTAAAILGITGANASTVMIDFETVPSGAPVVNNRQTMDDYVTLGVRFIGIENGVVAPGPIVTSEAVVAGGSGFSLWNEQTTLGTSVNPLRHDVLRIEFLNPVNTVSLATEFGIKHFEAYDASGQLLERFENVTVNPNLTFSSSSISRIDVLQTQDGFGYGIDNLAYDIVPEPSSYILSAFAIVFSLLRRRR